jgi:CO/xanthine dehydrogenase Mo-binding subunit
MVAISRQAARGPIVIEHLPTYRNIDRPGLPFLGSGDAGQGPASAAIANVTANATRHRLRDLPLSHERIKAAIGA